MNCPCPPITNPSISKSKDNDSSDLLFSGLTICKPCKNKVNNKSMVAIAQVRQSNAKLTAETVPRTAVFVGGTSGIGRLTLTELVSLGLSVKAYVVGRKATEAATRPLLEDLRRRNPSAELVWVEGEVSLLSETKRICEWIKARESRLDFLCLTAGYAPFGGRNKKQTPRKGWT
ncbi:hypothetical protein LZ30DRAFT_723866 [Colletotrichum cereale]|nr:hypothetical protein LZ30DRAFT_723866 [Colletotrichum cereale]